VSSVGSFFSYVNDARSHEPEVPKICWADLVDQYIIVASSWFFYITLPTLVMDGQTQIKFICLVPDKLNEEAVHRTLILEHGG